MAVDPNNNNALYLGIDGGGSQCRARIVDGAGHLLGQGRSGPANPVHGFNQAIDSIQSATHQALAQAGLSHSDIHELNAGFGLAGVNAPSYYKQMDAWQHPFKSLALTTDLHIACLGAHGGRDGAVIIIGTGSCGFASIGDKQVCYGGHGFPYGDKGSGAWIGLQAINAALLDLDNLGPETALTNQIMHYYQLPKAPLALVEKVAAKPSAVYAKLAPLVFDAAAEQDPVAQHILNEGSGYIDALAKKLLILSPPALSLIGGVSTRMSRFLSKEVQAHIVQPEFQPDSGAIYFAQKHCIQANTVLEVN